MVAASLAALIVACGGGGGDGSPNLDTAAPEVAWASPAVFVTPGAASKSFALSGCKQSSYIIGIPGSTSVDLFNAKLTIASSGDVSVQAATSTLGPITALWSMTYANAQTVTWSVFGDLIDTGYSMRMDQISSSDRAVINLVSAPWFSVLNANRNTAAGGFSISCASVSDLLVLQVNINPARAAKNLGTAAGVTSFDSRYLGEGNSGAINAGLATWSNASSPDAQRFLRFNLATGDLASSTASTGTFSPVSLALPATELEDGTYGETLTRGRTEFDSQDAKSACIRYDRRTPDSSPDEPSGNAFSFTVTAFGNKFAPAPEFNLGCGLF